MVNRTLGTMLQSLANDTPKQWDLKLPQAEFAFNSMLNRSMGTSPFAIIYTKIPGYTTNLIQLPTFKSISVENLADKITKTIEEVQKTLLNSNAKYKTLTSLHKRVKVFNGGDLVMVHLRKPRFSMGEYSRLKPKRFGPFRVRTKINDNYYIIDIPLDWNISTTFNVVDISE